MLDTSDTSFHDITFLQIADKSPPPSGHSRLAAHESSMTINHSRLDGCTSNTILPLNFFHHFSTERLVPPCRICNTTTIPESAREIGKPRIIRRPSVLETRLNVLVRVSAYSDIPHPIQLLAP